MRILSLAYTLALLLICGVIFAGQGVGPGPGVKAYFLGGGTQPASGTLLAGVVDSGTTAAGPFNPGQEVFSTPGYVASWTASATTTTASAIRVRLTTEDNGVNIKCLYRNASGALIASTNVNISVPSNGTYDLPFSTPPPVTKTNSYQLTCISDGYHRYGIIPSTGVRMGMDDSGSYATPATTLGTLQNLYPNNQMSIGLIK